ncbi:MULTISPECIES: CsbD family protein [Lactococcus]|uniref:CsbD family protein n=2 Tax=Lactococcus TaxID=1357 RepID=A0A387BG40_9LACT|nr:MULTISPECIES: CsbD family protein [Lactococcus]AYG00106.1 CsbD family protein [Lactococcus allomyrinae]MCL2112780.1 CsbD family protein [Streptococcaceae bacterium]QDK71062.1 CsbD family protein [Lactococcus protaetiae]
MTLNDKLDAAKDKTSGKIKEVAGKVTGDEKLEAKGKGEGLLGKAKEELGTLKDKASELADDVAEKFNDVVDSVKDKKDK